MPDLSYPIFTQCYQVIREWRLFQQFQAECTVDFTQRILILGLRRLFICWFYADTLDIHSDLVCIQHDQQILHVIKAFICYFHIKFLHQTTTFLSNTMPGCTCFLIPWYFLASPPFLFYNQTTGYWHTRVQKKGENPHAKTLSKFKQDCKHRMGK